MHKTLEALVITNDDEVKSLIEALLRKGGYPPNHIHSCTKWEDGLLAMQKKTGDIIVLISTAYKVKEPGFVEQIRSHALDFPMIFLHDGNITTEVESDSFSLGVQEVLSPKELSVTTLLKVVRSAVERQRMRRQIHDLSMLDELTGINNRLGFMLRAEQSVALSERLGAEANLFFLDADHMKWVNDNFGHQEGDYLLMEISRILQDDFRRTDVIGRVGGDEFAVLALRDSAQDVEAILERLADSLTQVNEKRHAKYPISFSIGTASSTRAARLSLEELMEIADKAMYENKNTKRGEGPVEKNV